MRKLCLFLILICMFSLTACKKETVMLCCDGDNCQNTVEVKVEKKRIPDESWVVFCQECADNVLGD